MGNFYTDILANDPRFSSPTRCNDLDLLEPVMRDAVRAILVVGRAKGVPLLVWETYRSQERQEMLFSQGATKLQKVGVHHYGLACDIVKSVNGEPSWKGDFTFLGLYARNSNLIWGGDWGQPLLHHTFIDADHVQRVTIARQTALFAGTWYPDAAYDPYTDVGQ